MRCYSSNIDDRMFDYKAWYDFIAKELPDKCRIVEVGAGDGASGIYLAEAILNLGKTIDKLYLVDSMDYGHFQQLKTIYTHLINAQLTDYVDIMPMDSLKAAKLFNGNSLDFVFLDSSHEYKSTLKEIKAWYPLLKDECILSGHDMTSTENEGVSRAVTKLLPYQITRKTIDEPDHYQEFEPEQFLNIFETERKLGVWWCRKNFYFKP